MVCQHDDVTVLRAVSYTERVSAAIAFWWSRFNKGPTPSEIAKLISMPLEHVEAALVELAAPRKAKVAKVTPIRRVSAASETLVCRSCLVDWTRPMRRGRKPSLCPSCA